MTSATARPTLGFSAMYKITLFSLRYSLSFSTIYVFFKGSDALQSCKSSPLSLSIVNRGLNLMQLMARQSEIYMITANVGIDTSG
jgi:hypothetical protein|tara:strand:- start:61 stop:315 length:255 start_codon:yes stop_codon:yes gene_type:complete